MAQICINSKGIKVVEIDKIKFKGKRKIDWRSVGENFKNYIGKILFGEERLSDVMRMVKNIFMTS